RRPALRPGRPRRRPDERTSCVLPPIPDVVRGPLPRLTIDQGAPYSPWAGAGPHGARYRSRPVESDVLFGIGVIIVLGVGLQWLARRLKFPSIILLLAGGLLVGPWLGLVDPDKILGPALFPVVSLAVGILLFVGGLELRISELGAAARRPVL